MEIKILVSIGELSILRLAELNPKIQRKIGTLKALNHICSLLSVAPVAYLISLEHDKKWKIYIILPVLNKILHSWSIIFKNGRDA